MGTKLKKFIQDADYYYQKAFDKSDAGDLIGCLEFLRRAQSFSGDPYCNENLAIRLEIAAIYAELGLYEESNREYYSLAAVDYALDEVYYGLIKNYAMLDMPEQAAHYLSFGIETGALLPEDDIESIDLGFLKKNEAPHIRLVKENDCTHTVRAARQLLCSSDTEFARKLLKTVSESSEQYNEASNYLALIEIGEGNVEEGIRLCDRVLENEPLNLYALTTRVLAFELGERKADARSAVAALDALDFNEWPDTAKVALCAAQIGDAEIAYKYLLRSLAFAPYDRELLLLHVLTSANLGKRREAKDAAVTLQALYPTDVTVRYYAREIDKASPAPTFFGLVPELPKDECKKLGEILEQAVETYGVTGKLFRAMQKNGELNEAVLWGLTLGNTLSATLARILARDPAGYSTVTELLVDPDYSIISKKEIFFELLCGERVREIPMTVNHQLQWYRPHIPAKGTCHKTLLRAYRRVYSTLVFIDSGFDRRLNQWFKKISGGFKTTGTIEFSENAVAAVLAYKSRINKIFALIPHACEVFGCTEEEFMVFYNRLGDASVSESRRNKQKGESDEDS